MNSKLARLINAIEAAELKLDSAIDLIRKDEAGVRDEDSEGRGYISDAEFDVLRQASAILKEYRQGRAYGTFVYEDDF